MRACACVRGVVPTCVCVCVCVCTGDNHPCCEIKNCHPCWTGESPPIIIYIPTERKRRRLLVYYTEEYFWYGIFYFPARCVIIGVEKNHFYQLLQKATWRSGLFDVVIGFSTSKWQKSCGVVGSWVGQIAHHSPLLKMQKVVKGSKNVVPNFTKILSTPVTHVDKLKIYVLRLEILDNVFSNLSRKIWQKPKNILSRPIPPQEPQNRSL